MPGRAMIKIRHVLFPVLLVLAACGSKEASANADDGNAMAGNWTAASGMKLTFDGFSDQVNGHGIPNEDGTHEHAHGTYTFDEKSLALTLKIDLFGLGKDSSWVGKLAGEALQLESGKDKVTFMKGGKPDGH